MSRRGRSKAALATLLTAGALGLAACGGDDESESSAAADGGAEPVTLRFAGFNPEQAPLSQSYVWWMDEVTARTDGAVEFEAFWDGSLLGPEEILPGLRDGRIDVGQVSAPYYPETFPLTRILEIPFLSNNPPAAGTAMTQLARDNEGLAREWEAAGAVPTGIGATAPSVIGSNEPIETTEDIRGLRIRVIGNQGLAVEAVGGTAVNLETAEVYEAMQRGLTDAFMGIPLDIVPSLALNEVSDYIVDPSMGVFASNGAVAVGQGTWDELPPEVQDVMLEVGQELPAKQNELFGAGDEAACELLENPPTVLPENEVAEWEAALGDTAINNWEEAASSAGYDPQEFFGAFQTANEEAAAEFTDYQTGVQRCAAASG